MTTILDGKALAKKITDNLKSQIVNLTIKPHLAVILVGESPASMIYVRNKQKKAEEIGIKSTLINYPDNIDEQTVLTKIKQLNSDSSVNAVLVQLPLPKQLDSGKIIETISPQKDVDGFTSKNLGKLLSGTEPFAYPCTPKGIISLLEEYKIDLTGKHVVIIGRSNIVGKPLAQMFLNKNATITVCHSYTKHLSILTLQADILISAVGKKIITENMIKKGAIIVDVGIFKDKTGKLTGDVDFEKIKDDASFITPVPGGVGPMTIASLMLNTFELFNRQNKKH